jgi:hypothetical protein
LASQIAFLDLQDELANTRQNIISERTIEKICLNLIVYFLTPLHPGGNWHLMKLNTSKAKIINKRLQLNFSNFVGQSQQLLMQ